MKATTVGVVAEILGISKVRVARLASDGVLPRAGRGLFDIPACVQAFVRYKVSVAAGDGTAQGLMSERTRLTKARADAAESEARVKSGTLVPADQIEAAWLAVAGTVKTRLLLIPTKIAARLSALKTPAETQSLLQKEIHAALTEIAKTPTV